MTLTEFRTSEGVALSLAERDGARRLHPGLRVEPTPGAEGRYDLTPDQRIGMVCLPGLVLEVRPKVPMSSVLFLVSHACDSAAWHKDHAEYSPDANLVEVLAIVLARLVEHATRRGLLHGYREQPDALPAPRGRIDFGEFARRRLALGPPVDVTHDEYTADILENRLLLSATAALGRVPLRSGASRRELFRAQQALGSVGRVHFPPSRVPDVVFTRLNRHYQPAIALATLLLRSASLDLGAGGPAGSAFLVDMNVVFERFVRAALREALGADRSSFPDRPPPARLDEAGAIPLKPDLCLVQRGRVAWVGDAKYKRLPVGAFANADLYQLLAYSVALGLPGGTLVYAADDGVRSAEHVVARSGKRLRVVALNLLAPPARMLADVAALAGRIRAECGRPVHANVAPTYDRTSE